MEDYYTIQSTDHASSVFENMYLLQQQGVVCDIILTADDGDVLAHKVVLMATSKYFREKLSPLVIAQPTTISMKGISVADLTNLVKYIYTGRLVVAKETMDVTLEIAEILELQGIIQGFKEIVAYEESTRGPGRSQVVNKGRPSTERRNRGSEKLQFTHNQDPGIKPTTVTTKQTGLVSNVAEKVRLAQSVNKDAAATLKRPEVDPVANTTITSQTGNEYNFTNINPYDQYVDVSVGPKTPSKNVHQTRSPSHIGTPPKLQQMGNLSAEQAQHQDLLAVAIETLSDAPGLLRKEPPEAAQKDTTEAEKAVSELELDCKEVVLHSKDDIDNIEIETGEELFVNGKTNTKTVTLNAGVVNNEMGGQTEVYTVSLDPSSIPGQILMPRPIKRRTVKEKKAEETAKMYRQRRAELLNPAAATASKPSEEDGSQSQEQQQDFRYASLSKQRMKGEMPKIMLVGETSGQLENPNRGVSYKLNAENDLDYGDEDDDFEDEDLSQLVPMDMNADPTIDGIHHVTIENVETGDKKVLTIGNKSQGIQSSITQNTDLSGSPKASSLEDRSSSTKRKTRTPKKLTGSDNESSPNENSTDRRGHIPLVRTRRHSKNEKGNMSKDPRQTATTSSEAVGTKIVSSMKDMRKLDGTNSNAVKLQMKTRSRGTVQPVGSEVVTVIKTESDRNNSQAGVAVPKSMLPQVRLRRQSDKEISKLTGVSNHAASNKLLAENDAGQEKQIMEDDLRDTNVEVLHADGTEIVRSLKRKNEGAETSNYAEDQKKRCFMFKCLVKGCTSVFNDENELKLHRKVCGNPRLNQTNQGSEVSSIPMETDDVVIEKVTKDVETCTEDTEVLEAVDSLSEKPTDEPSGSQQGVARPGNQRGKKAHPRMPIVTRGRAAKTRLLPVVDGAVGGNEVYISRDLEDGVELVNPIIYVCPEKNCMFSSPSLSSLKRHGTMEHPFSGKVVMPVEFSFTKISCGLCKFATQVQELLNRHYDIDHPGSAIPCPVCNETFPSVADLHQHCEDLDTDGDENDALRSVGEDGTKSDYSCGICGHTEKQLKHYQTHLVLDHKLTLITKHVKLNEKYRELPLGTLLMESGKVFDLATMIAPRGLRQTSRFVRITRGEKDSSVKIIKSEKENSRVAKKPIKSALYKLPMEEFTKELLKRHEEYLERPSKEVQFMSSSLAQATCYPSFPQASPSIRNSRANKLYNMPKIRPNVESVVTSEPLTYTVTQSGDLIVPRMDNEIEVRQNAGSHSSLVIGGSAKGPPKPGSTVLKLYKYKPPQYKEQMIIINSNGQQSIVRSKDFYQTLYEAGNESSETLEVISSLLEAGEEIEIREEAEGVVEIQNI